MSYQKLQYLSNFLQKFSNFKISLKISRNPPSPLSQKSPTNLKIIHKKLSRNRNGNRDNKTENRPGLKKDLNNK
jgi:hypothetical protein